MSLRKGKVLFEPKVISDMHEQVHRNNKESLKKFIQDSTPKFVNSFTSQGASDSSFLFPNQVEQPSPQVSLQPPFKERLSGNLKLPNFISARLSSIKLDLVLPGHINKHSQSFSDENKSIVSECSPDCEVTVLLLDDEPFNLIPLSAILFQ